MYPDRLDVSYNALKKAAEEKIQVDPEKKFTGFDAYKKVLESGVDLVILATPQVSPHTCVRRWMPANIFFAEKAHGNRCARASLRACISCRR